MQTSSPLRAQADSTPQALSVMIVTGEASGDVHAAELLRALKQRVPRVDAFGMGSRNLEAAGMEVLVDSDTHASVMGLTEVIFSAGRIITAFRRLRAAAKERKPDVLILLDFPDFNMRLAKAIKPYCKACVYFIAPQVWAWRRGRVKALRRDCSMIIPIFPFEEEFYHRHGAEARWLGHPFLDHREAPRPREEFLNELGVDSARPVMALLPGSRKAEVERLAPVLSEVQGRIAAAHPDMQFIVPIAPSLQMEWVAAEFDNSAIHFVRAPARDVLHAARLAVVASGTATLEAALCETPFVLVYKVAPLTYWAGRLLIHGTKFIGMPNIIAGRAIIPELLQSACTPEAICRELERLLSDEAYRSALSADLRSVAHALQFTDCDSVSSGEGRQTTVERAATEILALMERLEPSDE